jgi:hypothetical protein
LRTRPVIGALFILGSGCTTHLTANQIETRYYLEWAADHAADRRVSSDSRFREAYARVESSITPTDDRQTIENKTLSLHVIADGLAVEATAKDALALGEEDENLNWHLKKELEYVAINAEEARKPTAEYCALFPVILDDLIRKVASKREEKEAREAAEALAAQKRAADLRAQQLREEAERAAAADDGNGQGEYESYQPPVGNGVNPSAALSFLAKLIGSNSRQNPLNNRQSWAAAGTSGGGRGSGNPLDQGQRTVRGSKPEAGRAAREQADNPRAASPGGASNPTTASGNPFLTMSPGKPASPTTSCDDSVTGLYGTNRFIVDRRVKSFSPVVEKVVVIPFNTVTYCSEASAREKATAEGERLCSQAASELGFSLDFATEEFRCGEDHSYQRCQIRFRCGELRRSSKPTGPAVPR